MQTSSLRSEAPAIRAVRGGFLRSNVGLSALAAASGLLLTSWVALHMLGVLGALGGARAMDGYAALLHRSLALLWLLRLAVGSAALLHVFAVTALSRRAIAARTTRYVAGRAARAGWAARSMRWSGGALLVLLVLHILHMTTGSLHPDFSADSVYRNLVIGLATPWVAVTYAGGAALVALHLRHGVVMLVRGYLSQGRAALSADVLGVGFALMLGAGFALVPLAVVSGVLR